MATQQDVRRIALALPEVEEDKGRFAFSVRNKGKLKGIAWVWLERTEPHYNGYPAVLVHLKKVKVADLRLLLADAWRCQAPKQLIETVRD